MKKLLFSLFCLFFICSGRAQQGPVFSFVCDPLSALPGQWALNNPFVMDDLLKMQQPGNPVFFTDSAQQHAVQPSLEKYLQQLYGHDAAKTTTNHGQTPVQPYLPPADARRPEAIRVYFQSVKSEGRITLQPVAIAFAFLFVYDQTGGYRSDWEPQCFIGKNTIQQWFNDPSSLPLQGALYTRIMKLYNEDGDSLAQWKRYSLLGGGDTTQTEMRNRPWMDSLLAEASAGHLKAYQDINLHFPLPLPYLQKQLNLSDTVMIPDSIGNMIPEVRILPLHPSYIHLSFLYTVTAQAGLIFQFNPAAIKLLMPVYSVNGDYLGDKGLAIFCMSDLEAGLQNPGRYAWLKQRMLQAITEKQPFQEDL